MKGEKMDFYSIVNKRRTIRDFTEEPVPQEIIKRIIEAGSKAPSNDYMRDWQFFVATDRELIAKILKKIPKKVSDKRMDFIVKMWKLDDKLQEDMFRDAVPKQYEMLIRSGCLILPFYKQEVPFAKFKQMFDLNDFASIWCCVQNMLLAATAEGLGAVMRIPFEAEQTHIVELLEVPKGYIMPCYLAIGHPANNLKVHKQHSFDLDKNTHFNEWRKEDN